MVKVLFGSRRLIGIDIGSRFIKIADLEVSKKNKKLNHFIVIPTPEGVFSGSDIQNVEPLAIAIRAGLHTEKIKNKNVSLGLQGASVIVKKINMPKIDKKMLDQQIRWEAEQYIPYDMSQISLSYHINESSALSDSSDVLIVAAQKTMIEQLNQLAHSAGLKVGALDLSSFALANAFESAYGKLLGQGIMLVHVGALVTHVVIIANGEIVYVRDIGIGGHHATSEIGKNMGLSTQEAEVLKIAASRGDEVPEDIFSSIDLFNTSLAEEIKNSRDYFFGSQDDSVQLNQVYISGGSAKLIGLTDKISAAIEVPVAFFNVLGNISVLPKNQLISMDELMSISPIAIGLALRERGD